MDPTPHTKIRGDVAGQVSPPSEKIVPTPLFEHEVTFRRTVLWTVRLLGLYLWMVCTVRERSCVLG